MERQFRRKMLAARLACLLALTALLGAGTTEAATVNVDCNANQSLQAAINALDVVGPHTINVNGTCKENLLIDQRGRLTIQGPAGGTATLSSPTSTAHVVSVFRSRAIVLRRLVITGGARGVFLRHASELRIEGSRIENNSDTGLFPIENSTVLVGGTQAVQAVAITNNTGAGVFSNGSFITIGGFTTIEDNGGPGVIMQGGRSFIQGPGNGIRRNGSREPGFAGVRVFKGAALDLTGVDVSGNFGPGVQAEFNAVLFLTNATIANNLEDGVRVLRGAVANIPAGNAILGNGGANLTCDTTGLVVGDPAGITNINCMRVERTLGPPRPGEIVDLPDPPQPQQ
jgi:hypothetical protein